MPNLCLHKSEVCNVRCMKKPFISDFLCHELSTTGSSVISYIILCFYQQAQLRRSDIGCQLSGIYLGIWIHAMIFFYSLLAALGYKCMTTICKNFAKEMSLKFSTNPVIEISKTKCIIFYKDDLSSRI